MVKFSQYYMLTIKRNAVDYTSAHDIIDKYREVVSKVRNAEWAFDAYLELDRMKRIHLHTWFKANRKPNYRTLQSSNWTVHLDPFDMDDFMNVMSYCAKDNIRIADEEAVEWIDTHSYCFWTLVTTGLLKCRYKFLDSDKNCHPEFLGVTPFLNTEQSEVS